MPICSVCTHPRRKEIEAAIKGGRSLRSVEKEFGVPRSNISRHMSPDHFGAAVRAMKSAICPASLKKEIKAIRDASGVVDQIKDLIDKTNTILESAGGDPYLGLKAIEAARKNLETLAKLNGQLTAGGNSNTQINTGITPGEYNRTVSHVIMALEPFPEARGAVLAALEGITVIECETTQTN